MGVLRDWIICTKFHSFFMLTLIKWNQRKSHLIWFAYVDVQMIVYWFDMVHFHRLRWVWIIKRFRLITRHVMRTQIPETMANSVVTGVWPSSTLLLLLIFSRFLVDLFRRDIHRAQIMRYNRSSNETANGYQWQNIWPVFIHENTKWSSATIVDVALLLLSAKRGIELLHHKLPVSGSWTVRSNWVLAHT